MHIDFWQSVAVIVGTVVTVLTAIAVPVWKKFRTFIRGWELFMRDWRGEPEEPGRDYVPGVMERLNNIDGEFKRNSDGTTLKDAVTTMQGTLEEVLRQFTGMNDKVNRIDERVTKVDGRLDAVESKLAAQDVKDSE